MLRQPSLIEFHSLAKERPDENCTQLDRTITKSDRKRLTVLLLLSHAPSDEATHQRPAVLLRQETTAKHDSRTGELALLNSNQL